MTLQKWLNVFADIKAHGVAEKQQTVGECYSVYEVHFTVKD